jgi:hypothetical protein
VGKQLSAVINAFDEWGQKFGDDGAGLLVALGVRAAEGGAAADAAWRVGVHPPKDIEAASVSRPRQLRHARSSGGVPEPSALLAILRESHEFRAVIVLEG